MLFSSVHLCVTDLPVVTVFLYYVYVFMFVGKTVLTEVTYETIFRTLGKFEKRNASIYLKDLYLFNKCNGVIVALKILS